MSKVISIIIILLNLVTFNASIADEIHPSGPNAYELVTGDNTEGVRRHWDRVYSTSSFVFGKEPERFLRDHMRLLQGLRGGRALDIAMGEGKNSVFLAKNGYQVEGVDISEVALRKAKRLARENGVSITTIIADLNNYKIKPDSYHLILNFDILLRGLIPQLKKGLKHQGIIVFENGTVDQLKNSNDRQVRRDNLLKRGELKELFKDFDILFYRESNDGNDAKASLIARKP